MGIYVGKSADGSDMKEVDGVFINPDNPDEWSNQPYNKKQKASVDYWNVYDYMADNHLTLGDVYQQVKDKVCPLSRRLRDYVLSHYDENGNFIEQE